MKFRAVTSSDELWRKVRNYAESCSWSAGKALASAMDHNEFSDWERVIAAVDHEKICGYCTVSKTDCIPDVDYTPYIGFIFVGEEYRGNRLSQQLIGYAIDYIKNIGYNKVYIVSDHENLYEKYGFRVIVSSPGIRIFFKGKNLPIPMFFVKRRSLKGKGVHKGIFAAAPLSFSLR